MKKWLKDVSMMVLLWGVPAAIVCMVFIAAIEFFVNLNDETGSLWLNYACLFGIVYLSIWSAIFLASVVLDIIKKFKSKETGL